MAEPTFYVNNSYTKNNAHSMTTLFSLCRMSSSDHRMSKMPPTTERYPENPVQSHSLIDTSSISSSSSPPPASSMSSPSSSLQHEIPPLKQRKLSMELDIGVFVSEKGSGQKVDDADKYNLIVNHSTPSPTEVFPSCNRRRFQLSWLARYKWLRYSKHHNGGYTS